MPDEFGYDEDTGTLHVGMGRIAPVSRRVWDYEVSGLRVLMHWLSYRMKRPSGRKSSPLDELNASAWPAEWTSELLDVFWALERVVALEPAQEELVQRIVAAPLISESDLVAAKVFPVSPEFRDARPERRRASATLFDLP